MGPLSNVLGMMPGMGKAMKQLREVNMDERELDRLEAIILSMTPAERARPERSTARAASASPAGRGRRFRPSTSSSSSLPRCAS